MDIVEAFQTEIEFWNDMLCNQTEETPPEILQRMQMAKQLAEQKLHLYSTEVMSSIN
jgi:hypothetical protein